MVFHIKRKYFPVFLFVFFSALWFVSDKVHAAPAAPAAMMYHQPDGTVFYARQEGDEIFNWTASVDGAVLVQNKDDYWYYAELEGNRLTAGLVKYRLQAPPARFVTPGDLMTVYSYYSRLKQAAAPRQAAGPSKAPTFAGADVRTTQNLSKPHPMLVLLVNFNDVTLSTTESQWSGLIFGSSGKTVNSYYKEASAGRFYFTPVQETGGTPNDGVITVSLNRNHPNTRGNPGILNRQVVADALRAADSQVDYTAYDNDHNGYISHEEMHVMTIIAGQEAAYDDPAYSGVPSVWGHHWANEDNEAPVIDQVKLLSVFGGGYTQFGERQGNHQATIGIIVHELGHDLDLPDLYDVDPGNGGDTGGVGGFSVMGAGSWAELPGEYPGATPVHFDAWSKVFLGFAMPIELPYGSDVSATLNAVRTLNPGAYNVYKVKTGKPQEYFLLENREQGSDSGFDRSLRNFTNRGGVAIWHIDSEIIRNRFEAINDVDPKGVDLVSFDTSPKDPFYHDGYGMNNYSKPRSSYHDGTASRISVTVPDPAAYSMTVKAGSGPAQIGTPTVTASTYGVTFHSRWDEAADLYYEVVPYDPSTTPQAPTVRQLLQGADAAGNPAAPSGHAAVSADAPGAILVDGLATGGNYILYIVGVDADGHAGDSGGYRFSTAPPSLRAGRASLVESAANNGAVAGTQTITVTNGSFTPGIDKSEITVNNLPAGLDYSVTRVADDKLTLIFTGRALRHSAADGVGNISVTVAQAGIVGAASDVTSDVFAFSFNDPAAPVTVVTPTALPQVVITPPPPVIVTPPPAVVVPPPIVVTPPSAVITPPPVVVTPPPVPNTPQTPPPGPQVKVNGNAGVIIDLLQPESGPATQPGVKSGKTWKINAGLLNNAIETLKNQPAAAYKIAIPVTFTSGEAAIVELPADALTAATAVKPKSVISVETDAASYQLPVGVQDWQAAARRLGAELQDLKVNIILEHVTGTSADKLAQSAKASGLSILGSPVEFSVTITGNGKTEIISNFGRLYVSRSIVLDGLVNGQTASAVVYDPATGKLSFVPATFSQSGGKTTVTIQRNGNSIYTVVRSQKTFSDIQKHWARPDIELLASKSLIKGISDSSFAPNQFITRAEFAVIVAQSLGLTEDRTAASFHDMRARDWYSGYVGAAVKAGIVSGYSDGMFRPQARITREQMAVMITNAARFAGPLSDGGANRQLALAAFKDRASIKAYAQDAVTNVVTAGIMKGVKQDEFGPSELATRAQSASIMRRLLVHLGFIN